VKRLKVKVSRAYNRIKIGENYQAELKRLSKKLLTAKRNTQKICLSSVLQNEGSFIGLKIDIKETGKIFRR
jgi:hypothetical protein